MKCRWTIVAGCAVGVLVGLFFALRPAAPRAAKGNPAAPARPVAASPMTAVDADNALGFKLLAELRRAEPGRNVFISPLSIGMALHMTWNGAAGATAAEMSRALELGAAAPETINAANQALRYALRSNNRIALDIANSIWMRLGESFNPTFTDYLTEYYGAECHTADFADPTTVNAINAWCAVNTRNKIQQILTDIPGDDVMYLINAAYFKGQWQHQFTKAETREGPFHTSGRDWVTVPLMTQQVDVPGMLGDDFAAGKLMYDGGKVSMVVFVPDRPEGLAGLCARLTPQQWQQWLKQFTMHPDVRVVLPRFRVEYGPVSLVEPLDTLGMKQAFQPDFADFGPMRPNGEKDLFISNVLHKTFVEVNEEGTEAAAVTVVAAAGKGASHREFALIADRPFLYAICDEPTGAILFLGVMLDPSA